MESSTSLTSAGDLSSFSPLESEESVGEESVDAFWTVGPYAYEPVVQCLALLITKAFMVCWCCRQLTSTTDSVMVWLKRRPYTSKYNI